MTDERKKKRKPPKDPGDDSTQKKVRREIDEGDSEGTRTDKQKTFYNWSGELSKLEPTHTEHFGSIEKIQPESDEPALERPDQEPVEETRELSEPSPLELEEPLRLEEDEDSTLTEFGLSDEPVPEGPAIELPRPTPKQPVEIGPSHGVDPGEETFTDVLRVEEPLAADAEEPVSQPPAASDPASGTQPSLFQDQTKTDVFRPDEERQDLPEQVLDQREAQIETHADFDPDRTATYDGPNLHEQPTGSDPFAHGPSATETGTDLFKPGDFDAAQDKPAQLHEAETADLGEQVEEREAPALEQTRTDFQFSTPITQHEPIDWAPDEREPKPAPQRPRLRPKRRVRRPRARPSVVERLTEFFAPRNFFAGVRQEWQSVKKAWTRSGQRARSTLAIEKNGEWWRRTTVEIAALFAIVVPVEMAVGSLGSFGAHPHPYWLIVLPMAGARGVVAGLLSAGVASALYAVGAILALGHADILTLKTMVEPILFFGVGFFAGELHDELALRYRKALQALAETKERNQSLRQQRDVLADANKLLERRIVDHSVQFGNLVVAATRIENAGRTEVFEIAMDLVEEHCGAAASVLLLLGDGSIDFLCHNGWPDDEVSQRLADARASEFVQRAIDEGKAVNGFRPEEKPPESGPLVVAPLFDDVGLVRALLCLDEIPASRLNESTITIFFGISDWLSATLARLARTESYKQQRAEPRPGPAGEVWLGRPEDLGDRLRLELERCARYGVATSFLAIQAPEWEDTSREGLEAIDRFICLHFTGGLRPSDTIYKFGYPGCYLLVLAGTTVEGAEVVRKRLLRRVQYAPSKQIGPIEIFATGPDTEAPDLLSLAARVAGRFRERSPLALDGSCPVQVPEETRPGNVDDFIRRLRMETSLATRNDFSLHVVGILAEIAQTAEPKLLARHVHKAGVQTLRPTDGVYSIGPHQCVVLLPCTDGEEAAVVAHRLVQAVRARDPDAPYGALETQVLGLGTGHADVGSFLQALAQQEETHE